MKKLRTLEVLRNLRNVEYRLGMCTLEELNESENNLSKHLNNN
jgi:hypothetical protein